MKKHHLLILLLSAFTLFIGCQKEISFEDGSGISDGSLKSNVTGDCLPKTVAGTYTAGTALVATNYIEVQVDVISPGSYVVYTDTINGMHFIDSGTFGASGLVTVKLKGRGLPVNDGISNFTVNYDSTECVVPVTVLPAGGGPTVAAFTLDGSPTTCMNFSLQGTYTVGVPCDATNKVDIKVTVTTPGTWTVTTTATNGMTFTGSGTFAANGPATMTLTATPTSTPVTAGATSIPVTAGTTNCSFTVTVNPATPANDYFPRITGNNWSYESDDVSDDSVLRKVISPVKTVGTNSYNIFMITDNALNGFDSSGYYRKAGGDYYEFVDMGGLWGFDNTFWVEYIFLKDNVNAGVSWQSASYTGMVGAQSVTFRLNYKVNQKDISVLVNGTTYPNTIVIDEKVDVLVGGVWTDATSQLGYFKSYYARNVGLIKQESLDPSDVVDGQVELRRYQVF